MVHHPVYKGNVFAVFADVMKMGEDIEKDMQPMMRIQMKDYPKDRLVKLLPFPGGKPVKIKEDVDDLAYLDDMGEKGESLMAAFQNEELSPFGKPPGTKLGKTTQMLIDDDGNVVDLELKEYDELL